MNYEAKLTKCWEKHRCHFGSPEAADAECMDGDVWEVLRAADAEIAQLREQLAAANERATDLAAHVDRLLEALESDESATHRERVLTATPPTGVLDLMREVEPEIEALIKCNQPATGKDEWVERLRDMHARIKALLEEK